MTYLRGKRGALWSSCLFFLTCAEVWPVSFVFAACMSRKMKESPSLRFATLVCFHWRRATGRFWWPCTHVQISKSHGGAAIAWPLTQERVVGNILHILWGSGSPPLSTPPREPRRPAAAHTLPYTPAARNNVLNAIIVRPKQRHLSREHLGLYNKFQIINTIFHPLSSLSDLWHACDLRWSLNYNFSNKRENGPGLLLLPTDAHPPPASIHASCSQTHTQTPWINSILANTHSSVCV